MKNDSKERLEKQLNDNPELKERFVMQMSDIRDITEATRLKFKPIAESFKAPTALLEGLADSLANLSSPFADIMGSLPTFEPSQSIAKSMELFNMKLKPILDSLPTLEDLEEAALLLNKIKKEYTLLRSSEAEFIEHERLFVPKGELGVYEFVDWYLYCYLFDKPFDVRKEKELTLYHFNLFYEFKQRYKTHEKWGVEDERKFIKELESSDSDNKENVSDNPDWDLTASQWGATFYYVNGAKLLTGQNITDKLEVFHEKHNIDKTLKHVRVEYYETKRRINQYNNYPIDDLEKIIPFLEKYYKLIVNKVKNDIILLQEYKDENE